MSVLIENLHKDHDISILTTIMPARGKHLENTYKNWGIPITYFPWGWLPVDLIGCRVDPELSSRRCRNLRQYLPDIKNLSEKNDVICFNGYPSSYLASVFPVTIPKFLIAREVLENSSRGFSRCVRFLKRHINHAIAIGPVEAEQLQNSGIPNTIVFNSPRARPVFSPLPATPPLHFGVFTQFVACKGLDTLVLASKIIETKLRRNNVIIHIYGGSPDGSTAPLQNEIKSFLENNNIADIVRLEGWTSDVETKMKEMHCIVRPDATGSPWGRDVIEAMSIGRPVLATGHNEVFIRTGETGWLTPPNDVNALAQAISNLTHSRHLLEYFAKNSFEFALKNFDPVMNSQKIEKIFASVLQ